ncbi:LOW QUALITY PROTEIN: uncharacterized protein KZ484_021072 [Pholidichthys leucotaenia]
MVQKGVQLDAERFSCSICLDLLKDLVMIACGHNYCMNCINKYWDDEEEEETHSCPQCKQTFRPRPVLVKNTMLTELVEELKKTGLLAVPGVHCYAGAEDVACDFCMGRKLKAIKSCLVCQVSYYETHLQPHYDVAPLKKHKLVEPSKNLQESICSHHDEMMKILCRTDQQIICYLCSMDHLKGHNTVSAAAERTERQREVEGSQRNIHQRIQNREEDVKLLQQPVEAINRSADKTVEDSEKMFTELICVIQKRSSDVKQQVRSQQETGDRVKDLQEKVKQEISELKRRDTELEQLSCTEDDTQFLHSYPSLSAVCESTHSPSTHVLPLRYFEDVTAAVSELRDKLQELLTDTWTNISLIVIVDGPQPQPEPKTRAEFLKYSQEITLDLSEENRKVTATSQQSYPPHPERFTYYWQVLSKESLSGHCYWEVELSGDRLDVAVTCKNISRRGNESLFGYNDKSWALECEQNSFAFIHNRIQTLVSDSRSFRIGVFLDHSAGLLSFYSVSETMTLLHRVQTTFTQPLYAGFRVWEYGTTAEGSQSLFVRHEKAYQAFCKDVIEERIKAQEEILRLTKLQKVFVKAVKDEDDVELSHFRTKLEKDYPELVFHLPTRRNEATLVYYSGLSMGSAVDNNLLMSSTSSESSEEADATSSHSKNRDMFSPTIEQTRILYLAGLILKNAIKEKKGLDWQWPPTAKDLNSFNLCDLIPAELFNLISVCVGDIQEPFGSGYEVGHRDDGKLLSRFGHCCSPDTIMVYETSLAMLRRVTAHLIPDGFVQKQLLTMVWDNIDFNEETMSGAGTTHHTNGIMLQAIYAKIQEIRWANDVLKDSVLGKRFGIAGLKDILIESIVVAEGSINGVLSGRHYNRAIHSLKIVHEAFEQLRFEAFIDTLPDDQQNDIIAQVSELPCTSAFYGKGKKKPLDIALQNIHYLKAFEELGADYIPNSELISILTEFVCNLYGRKCKDVNEARGCRNGPASSQEQLRLLATEKLLFIEDTHSGRQFLVDFCSQKSLILPVSAERLAERCSPLLTAANGSPIW